MQRPLWRRLIPVFVVVAMIFLAFSVAARAADETTVAPQPTSAEEQLMTLIKDLTDFIEENHLNPPDRETLLRAAVDGLFKALNDPYSAFLSKSEMDALDGELSGQFGGVGVTVELIYGVVTVTAPLPGTPANAAGIKAGDQIIAVNGSSVAGNGLSETSALIRGEPGTQVTLTIRRGASTFDVTLTRQVIDVANVVSRLLPGDIGYIQVVRFAEGVGDRVNEELAKYRDLHVKGIILDFRDNPGGLLTEAVSMTGDFLPDSKIVGFWLESKTTTLPVPVAGKAPEDNPRLVVLVNSGSASASELTAAAIQDLELGTVIGETTYGKGVVQSLYQLETGEGIKLTTARYLTPGFRSVDGTGVTPDIVVSQPTPVSHTVAYQRDMKSGLVGLDVLSLEQGLELLGYTPGTVDGVYDDSTARAVTQFQAVRGIVASGIADANTIQVLDYSLKAADDQANSRDTQLERAIQFINEGK